MDGQLISSVTPSGTWTVTTLRNGTDILVTQEKYGFGSVYSKGMDLTDTVKGT